MKKRKPPIVLGALFVVLFGTVLAINAASLPPSQAEIEQKQQDEATKMAANRPKASKDAKKYVRESKDSDAKFTNQKSYPGIPVGAPKVVAPIDYEKRMRAKMNPDDHLSAMGGWYTPESGVGQASKG